MTHGDASGRVSAAHWRRWALLSILGWSTCAWTTSALKNEFDRKGWGHLLPANGCWDSLHRALLAEEKAGKVRRLSGHPSRWQITQLGRDFAYDFIIGQPQAGEGCGVTHGDESGSGVWPHESCFECGLLMPSDEHAETHYAMTGHQMGWPLDAEAALWPVATDDQVMGRGVNA